MTSKRLGMVLAAVFVLWSLAGTGWFAPGPSDWNTQVSGVSLAFAGDPDSYEDSNSDSEGNPGQNPEPDSGSRPPSEDEDTGSRDDDVVQTLMLIISLIFSGMP